MADTHPNAWALYRACFTDGEDVIVITSEEEFKWGKLTTTPDAVILKRSGYKEQVIPLVDIWFMSHDGFPVQELWGADGSEAVAELDTTNPQAAIREAFALYSPKKKVLPDTDELESLKLQAEYRRGYDIGFTQGKAAGRGQMTDSLFGGVGRRRIGGGDPWMFEFTDAVLHNSGNAGPMYWGHVYEETLVLTARDGAMAHLFDLSVAFYYEDAAKWTMAA